MSLREKIISIGGKDPGKLEDPRPLQFNFSKQNPLVSDEKSPAPPHEPICMDESVVIGVSTLQNQLQDLCDRSQELCRNAVDEITSLVRFVKGRLTELYERQSEADDAESAPPNVQQTQLEQAVCSLTDRSYEELKTRLEKLRSTQNDFLAEFAKKCSTLRSEYDNYRNRVNEQPKSGDRTDMQHQLNVALEELKMERDKANQGRDRMRMTEIQMQKARVKIRDLESHLANEQTTSQQLQNNIRSLEMQLRQKDQTMEQRMRDMHKAMKSSEDLMAKMEKQRDSFESRLSICHRLSVRSFPRFFARLYSP
jgi:chromosome segregation ATPase